MRRFAPALLLCLACLPAFAQGIKPGLWETTQKAELPPEQQAKMEAAQKQMAALPPEQRAMMEKMMASHGVQMSMSGNGAITMKSCVSAEQAKLNAPPVTDGKSRCTHDVQRSGNVIRTHFVCAESRTEGDSEVVLQGDGYTSKTRITHQRNGKPETISMTGSARWLGSDCGGLKPIEMPTKTK